MSLILATSRNNYTGNGSTAVYNYTFKITAATDLKVTSRLISTGVETPLVLGVDYTVTGVGVTAGGTITLVAGNLPSTQYLSIRRVRPLTQLTDIRNQSAFYGSIHEDEFDDLVMQIQQLQDQIDRAAKLTETIIPSTFDPTLPSNLNLNPDATLVVNHAGNGFTTGPTTTTISSAITSAAAAATSAANAATSATAAAASATAAAASAASASAGVGPGDIPDTPFTIVNNQAAAANVTGLAFNSANVGAAFIYYWIKRVTTGGGATELTEMGTLDASYDVGALTWRLTPEAASPDDSGVVFSITSAGQVQYTSSNITGTASVSKMRFSAKTLGV